MGLKGAQQAPGHGAADGSQTVTGGHTRPGPPQTAKKAAPERKTGREFRGGNQWHFFRVLLNDT